MKTHTFRLRPGELLKEAIERCAREKQIRAGVLLSIVGGLQKAVLRMADATVQRQAIKTWDEPFEIVSGTGTISDAGCHIHVSLSNRDGAVVGGHLKDGCVVKFTAEIVIGIIDDAVFTRDPDEETGFTELIISPL